MADSVLGLEWMGEGLRFRGGVPGGPIVEVDGDGETALSPMQTMLASIAACTAADVVDILVKMRKRPDAMDIWAEADRVPEPPRRFTRIRLVYRVAGLAAEDEANVRRAVELSHEKYCSALQSLRPDIEVESEVVLR